MKKLSKLHLEILQVMHGGGCIELGSSGYQLVDGSTVIRKIRASTLKALIHRHLVDRSEPAWEIADKGEEALKQ